ncbi:hypothetical protein IT575_04235 [bacterium]|nr:hypothetical protein [bacterium]
MALPAVALAAPDRLDDEIPDAAPSEADGLSASYGFSSLSLDGPQNSESTWHNYFKFRYQFGDDIGLRLFYNTHDLAGGHGLLSPVFDAQDQASAYGFDLSMNMLNVPSKSAKESANKAFEAGSAFNIGVSGKVMNMDAGAIGQSDSQISAYLAYTTDLTEKMRAHTYFSTGRISGDSHSGSVNRVGAGLDYVLQRGRHPLVLMANGLLDIYNFRQPSFNTARISRFDIGLRYKIRRGLYASAGLQTLNDSENDASGSGIFAGLNYVDEAQDWSSTGKPLPVLPPPPPPAEPAPADPNAQQPVAPPPAQPQADAGAAVEVLQAPLMASNQTPQQSRTEQAQRQAAGTRSASGLDTSQEARDAHSGISDPGAEQPAYTDAAMLDSGLAEKVDGGAYFYDPELAALNASALSSLGEATAQAGQDATAGRPQGALVAEIVDPSGVAVPAFPLSEPQATRATASMVRPPAGAAPSGRNRERQLAQKQAPEHKASQKGRAGARAEQRDTSGPFGLSPQEADELGLLLAANRANSSDDGSVMVLQRSAVLGPDFGGGLDWPLTSEAHIEVLEGGWVSYCNFSAEE